MSFRLTYETVKYVNIKDSRLAILRTSLLLAIVVYVGLFEMWGQGGWLEVSPVVGVVRFSLQQPTLGNCDPTSDSRCENAFRPLTELPYCQQSPKRMASKSSDYSGNVYPCEIYEATNAQIISEKSIAIITRASTREEKLVCGKADMVCPRTYNSTSAEHKFFTAQSEAFTILFDHSVTSSKICTAKNNYACSSESAKHQGRLYSKNDHLCAQEFAKGNAFVSFRGDQRRAQAPCYIKPNTTSEDQDFFSLDVLLKAVDINLDDCNRILSSNNTCQTYRDTGATLILNIFWADFHAFHGMVEPFYYYAPQFLAGSSFKQSIPFYRSYRSSRTLLKAHGIRVAVLLGGEYHQFNIVSFLVTLTTALGLLAVATTVVDALMLYVLPEKKRYQQAKYEEEDEVPTCGVVENLQLGHSVEAPCDTSHDPLTQDMHVSLSEPLLNTAI